MVPGQELTHQRGHHGGAAHAAAHKYLEANLTSFVFDQLQAHVVPAAGGAVFLGTHNRNLEFARQEGELRVQRGPLAQDFCVGAGVYHLVHGNTRQRIGGGVANAVAAGLNAVQVGGGQQVHHIGSFAQWNPVELHIGARGEVGAVRGQKGGAQLALAVHGGLEDFGLGLVVLTRYLGQYADLLAVDFTVGNGHAQHGRVALHVPAVLQAQGAKVVFGKLAALPAFQLVTELGSALLHEGGVEFCVLVHGAVVIVGGGASGGCFSSTGCAL